MQFSPTQIEKYRRCPRGYAFEYVENHRPPPSTKQEFGKSVHRVLERWLRTGELPGDDPVGRVAKQGIRTGWLPTPGEDLLVEREFVFPWADGIELDGFIDCVDARGKMPLVIDHKTTSDLRWAKRALELKSDPQVLVYGVWAMLEFKAISVKCRWIYYAATNPKSGPRKPAGALPVEVNLDANDVGFREEIEKLNLDLRKMLVIRSERRTARTLEANPRSCEAYGGCYHRDLCQLDGGDRLEAYLAQAEKV